MISNRTVELIAKHGIWIDIRPRGDFDGSIGSVYVEIRSKIVLGVPARGYYTRIEAMNAAVSEKRVEGMVEMMAQEIESKTEKGPRDESLSP